MKVSKGC